MKIKQHDYLSSQQSPYFLPYEHKYRKSFYSGMFLEDFSQWFSSTFTPIGMRDGFYKITPEDDELKRLLQFNYYSDFDHYFDELLRKIVYYLLINGKTYVEIVSITDRENIVKGIELVCIPAKRHRIRRNKYRLTARSPENKNIQLNIDVNRLVIFDLTDIGFHRNYFRKMMNHLSVLDETNLSELMLNPQMNGIFDFDEYKKTIEYKLLKDTSRIHWLGRNYFNQHLSESYHLYREMRYKNLRYKFLEYLLGQINAGLNYFKAEWGFAGEISASVALSRYEDAFSRYSKGEINTSELGDIVIKNLTLTETRS